jgi:glycerol uptake facilitator-like aquaporin
MAEVRVVRKLAAEFVGTAALVVCGPGTAAATGVLARSTGVPFSWLSWVSSRWRS